MKSEKFRNKSGLLVVTAAFVLVVVNGAWWLYSEEQSRIFWVCENYRKKQEIEWSNTKYGLKEAEEKLKRAGIN